MFSLACYFPLFISMASRTSRARQWFWGDPKFNWTLLLWAPANLFLVCIPEEAMFRMLIQGKLVIWLVAHGYRPFLSIYAAAILFGLIHFRGGPVYMATAAMAGVAYGFAYQAKRNPWHPALAHFGLNLTHFLHLAYPFSRH
jgi:membrane protease YdiL (CAAX protease family)